MQKSVSALNILTVHLTLIFALLLTSCSGTPVLNSNLSLPANLSAPERVAIDHNLAKKLPKPEMNPAELAAQGLYYSANGHACKKLSSIKAVCYINGQWLETPNIFEP